MIVEEKIHSDRWRDRLRMEREGRGQMRDWRENIECRQHDVNIFQKVTPYREK